MISCTGQQGSGNALTQTRRVSDFNRIYVKGSMQLNITQSDTYSVMVTADDNVVNGILTPVKDGRLIIENRKHVNHADIIVNITTPTINNIEIVGSTETCISGKFNVHDIDIHLDGSGNFLCNELESDGIVRFFTKGSTNVNVSGHATSFACKCEGSGNIIADHLEAGNVTARLNSSGNVFVKTNGTLNVAISASGSLFYNGTPQNIVKKIYGSGSVLQR